MGIFVGIGNYIGRVRQIGDGGGQPIGPNDYYIITEDVTQETRWTYVQVHLHGQPDHKECIKAIIRQYVDQDEEFDLINSSNSIVLGLSDNQTDRQKYLDYLTLVGEIKTKVRADFNV